MRGEAVKLDLTYLKLERDRYGKARLYFRRNGKKTRIKEEPGTDAFHRVYAALIASPVARPKTGEGKHGSVKWLCERYYGTTEFNALSARTQRVRRNLLDDICAAVWHTGDLTGALPFALMEPVHVRIIRDEKAALTEAANARVKALRQVFKWAKQAGHVAANPALEVAYVHKRTDGHHTWTVAEVERFWERWPLGTKEHLALSLLLFTGARRSDVVRLGRGMEADGTICFRAAKNSEEVTVPILPELRASIDACPSGHMTYLVTQFGQPFTANGFGNWFAGRCIKAGVPGRAHGLRKAGATVAADNGASDRELMAIYGWRTVKQAELYTRKANRKRLAKSGMAKLKLAHSS